MAKSLKFKFYYREFYELGGEGGGKELIIKLNIIRYLSKK